MRRWRGNTQRKPALSGRKRYQHRDLLWRRFVRGDLRSPPSEIERYGSLNGGWLLPSELITPNWLVYDFGVGDDISFDIALVETSRLHDSRF